MLYFDIDKYANKDFVHILPPCIKKSLDNENFEKIAKNRWNRKIPNLLFLSNMIESKGVFVALNAANILKNKGYDFKFYFAGNWGDITSKGFFSEVRKNDLDDRVEYLGFLEKEDKFKALGKSDILVYPTYKDIFGIVNLEAMEFGLPIVSTQEGAIPEIVEHNITGLLTNKKDAEGIAENIERLLNDIDLRIKMGKAGRQKFLSEFIFEKFENRLLDIFNISTGNDGKTSELIHSRSG